MSEDERQQRVSDCRVDVLLALYARRHGAHAAETIRTVFLRTRDYSLDEVKLALTDLERMHHVESAATSGLDPTLVYQITGQGITFKERGMK
jgi:hypothetical protein